MTRFVRALSAGLATSLLLLVTACGSTRSSNARLSGSVSRGGPLSTAQLDSVCTRLAGSGGRAVAAMGSAQTAGAYARTLSQLASDNHQIEAALQRWTAPSGAAATKRHFLDTIDQGISGQTRLADRLRTLPSQTNIESVTWLDPAVQKIEATQASGDVTASQSGVAQSCLGTY